MGYTMERDIVLIKYYMIGAILVIGLTGGMLPLLIMNFAKNLAHLPKEKDRKLLGSLNMFTSALMLSCWQC